MFNSASSVPASQDLPLEGASLIRTTYNNKKELCLFGEHLQVLPDLGGFSEVDSDAERHLSIENPDERRELRLQAAIKRFKGE